MSIALVPLTATFSQWLAADNQMITYVNSLSETGELLSVVSPTPGQMLVYSGEFFSNVTLHGDATLGTDGTLTVTNTLGAASDGRIFFAGNMRGLY